MKGDYSRFTFQPQKRYSGVRMQQGRVQLDADWNEQLDIQNHLRRVLAADVVGAVGAAGDGFRITASGLGLQVAAGRIYVDGILCENEKTLDLDQQPDLPGYALPTEDGDYIAYIDVWPRHITALEDPDLLELALGGPDTATRLRTIWQVKLLPVTNASCAAFTPDWTADGSAAPTLTARGIGAPSDNRLYRVEVHRGGGLGTATFKWSRDNGAVAAGIANPSLFQIQILNQVGQDTAGRFAAGQWVEVTDDGRVLRGEPGSFARIAAASGQVITVEGWPGSTDAAPDLPLNPVVRRWESDGGASGDLTIQIPGSNEGYIALEDGLEILFGDGTFRTGDAWVIPTRAQGGVLWPLDAAGQPVAKIPDFVRHHFAPLAVLNKAASGWTVVSPNGDCRSIFLPVTQVPGPEKLNRIGDDTMMGSLTITNNLTVDGATRLEDLLIRDLAFNAVTTGGSDGATVSYTGNDDGQRLRLAVPEAGSLLSLNSDGVDLVNLIGGKLAIGDGHENPQADFHLKVDQALIQTTGELCIEGPLKIADGSPGEGKVLTSDTDGRVRWEALPERELGVPMFLSKKLLVATGPSPFDWRTFNLPSDKVPATASAVILQGTAGMTGPNSDQITASIRIRAGSGEPSLILLQGRAAGSGDNTRWGGQGIFPIKNSSFQYAIDVPGFNRGFDLYLIGYFP